jgi:hypothetical protein
VARLADRAAELAIDESGASGEEHLAVPLRVVDLIWV